MKKLTLLLVLFLNTQLNAQDFGTKGTEFWLTYMENLELVFNGDPQFSIFISAENSGTATIEAPATGLSLVFDYEANEVTEYVLPPALFYAEGSEDVENLGLKITTETATNIFAVHYRIYFSEATLVLPTPALGNEYIVSAAKDFNNTISSPSSFVIVATEDDTEVEIIPSSLTFGLRPADIPFTIILNAGQSYQVQASGDLTGTQITTNSDQKIAVFGGALKGYINCSEPADNHLYDQIYPVSAAANSYALIPFKDQGESVFKILATEDDTDISLNGSFYTSLQKGAFVQTSSAIPQILDATKGVMVTQFNPSLSCNDSQLGDPNMLQLCPIGNRIKTMNFENLLGFGDNMMMFSKRCLTLLTETENTATVSIDGNPVNFISFPDNPSYSYAEVELTTGTSSLDAPDGVLAFAYGFGEYDAYTYHLGFDQAMSTSNNEIVSKTNYSISPNPSSDWVDLSFEKEIDHLQLFDLQGHLLFEDFNVGLKSKINLSGYPSAVYILKVKSDHIMITEKLIKY